MAGERMTVKLVIPANFGSEEACPGHGTQFVVDGTRFRVTAAQLRELRKLGPGTLIEVTGCEEDGFRVSEIHEGRALGMRVATRESN